MYRLSIVVLVVLSNACTSILPTKPNKVFMKLESPTRAYSVEFMGEKERPAFGLTSSVIVDVIKNGEPYVIGEPLHYGEAMDVSFEAGYPKYRWVGDATLRLYHSDEALAAPILRIKVVNASNRLIKFMKLFTSDKFLIFDLSPSSSVELRPSLPKGDFMGFYLEGEFGDKRRFDKGTSFEFNRMDSSCDLYTVTISDNEIDFNCS